LKVNFTQIFPSIAGLVVAALVLQSSDANSNAATLEHNRMEYRITIGKRLRQLDIELCFGHDNKPDAMVATDDLSRNIGAITAKLTDGSSIKLRVQDRTIEFKGNSIECIDYELGIPAIRGGSRRSGLVEHNGAIAMALERILLRPLGQERWQRTRLTFYSPPGINVSAPGMALPGEPGRRSYDLLDRPLEWEGSIAFGQLTQSLIELGGAAVMLSIVGDTSDETTHTLHEWIVAGVDAISTLYGRFPVPQLQVLVFPVARNSDPVPWGEVTRGGGDAVRLYVDGTRPITELNANWVLAHELSHLIHPYISGTDAWLPEGIASYFQNVLRARSSLLEPKVGWQKLDAGFKRGRAQFASNRTLARDTRKMMQEYQYMRVYWSGAAIAFIGDVDLRQRSDGAVSLDTVFEELSRCCLPSRHQWSAHELMTKMDEIAGYDVFMPLYRRYVMQPMFPDLGETYRRLGLDSNADGLHLSFDAITTSLRDDIMGAR
jgi:hypothetical protein